MSATLTAPYPPVLVRVGQAEHLDSIGHVLLADSSTTGGALTSHRVALARGAASQVRTCPPPRRRAGERLGHRRPDPGVAGRLQQQLWRQRQLAEGPPGRSGRWRQPAGKALPGTDSQGEGSIGPAGPGEGGMEHVDDRAGKAPAGQGRFRS
jgi:hypothetical protein